MQTNTYVTTTHRYPSEVTRPLYRTIQAVWYITGILEALLAFRFLLKLFGANPNAGFTDFIYSVTYPFVAPFLSVFRVPSVQGSTMEWTTLLAMLVYWLIAVAIIRLLAMNRPVSHAEASEKLQREDI